MTEKTISMIAKNHPTIRYKILSGVRNGKLKCTLGAKLFSVQGVFLLAIYNMGKFSVYLLRPCQVLMRLLNFIFLKKVFFSELNGYKIGNQYQSD